MKSLRQTLNVVKQSADDDANGVRAYLEEIGLSVGLLKRTTPADLEKYTQKSKAGNYCPWFVLGGLKKAAKDGLADTIKAREDAEKAAKNAAKAAAKAAKAASK